jgi:hypothetical protein
MAKNDKPVKDRYVGARVDEFFDKELTAYLSASEDLTMGDMVRKSLKEFMLNHPIKGVPSVDPAIKSLAGQE